MSDLDAHADEVAAAFALGPVTASIVLAARGEQARIWRLETESGVFAVKQPHRGFEPRCDGVDIAFQEAVTLQTDVFTPTPVRRPGGAFVVPVGEWVVRVSTWHDLAAPDPGVDPTEVGRVLAALHSVEFSLAEDAEVDPWFHAPVGPQAWQELTDRAEAAGAPFAATLRDEVPHLLALEGLLEPPRDLRMCHRDLWSDNLLRAASGGLCVIDWDNCGPADPAHELGVLVFEFGQWDARRMRALHTGYRAAGGPARLERPGHLSMLIAQFGHFWQLAVESWLDPAASSADRAHQEDRIAELMDPPLRVATVYEILTAVTAVTR